MSSVQLTIKKNLIIFHNQAAWETIWQRIVEEYGPSIAISWVCRRELGFSVRNHQHWVTFDYAEKIPRKYLEEQVHLDFFNPATQSWFQLKYL